MKSSGFVFDYVHFLFYKCHKINPNCGRSYIDSADWIKNKKIKMNSIIKKDKKCFQYVKTVVLNHEKIGKHSERITKIKTFTDKYHWEELNFPLEKYDWKKLEENNVTISLNVLYTKKGISYPYFKT